MSPERIRSYYESPLGKILLLAEDGFLIHLGFVDVFDDRETKKDDTSPVFLETKRWLDLYFSGKKPDYLPPYKFDKATPFQYMVFREIEKIPYGKTITYGEIAKNIAKKLGKEKMSSQAVGGAVGSNPLCIIVPCHRVMGAKNQLTGYAEGIERKIALLKLEGHETASFSYPKKIIRKMQENS